MDSYTKMGYRRRRSLGVGLSDVLSLHEHKFQQTHSRCIEDYFLLWVAITDTLHACLPPLHSEHIGILVLDAVHEGRKKELKQKRIFDCFFFISRQCTSLSIGSGKITEVAVSLVSS